MAITNYTQLQSSIASWLLRDDLTAVIPDFITLAEAQFNREIRNRKMIKRATATIDSQYSAVPSDWLQNVDLVMETNPVTTLQFVTSEQLESAPYLVEDERIAVWGGIYTKLINDLNIADSNARIGDSTLRIRATALQ